MNVKILKILLNYSETKYFETRDVEGEKMLELEKNWRINSQTFGKGCGECSEDIFVCDLGEEFFPEIQSVHEQQNPISECEKVSPLFPPLAISRVYSWLLWGTDRKVLVCERFFATFFNAFFRVRVSKIFAFRSEGFSKFHSKSIWRSNFFRLHDTF